jgi:hypothetical protein
VIGTFFRHGATAALAVCALALAALIAAGFSPFRPLDLLFLPLWFLVPNFAAAAALVALVLGSAATASTMLGVVAAILHYEWTHTVAHPPIRPLTPLGRWIKQCRLRRHYISEKLWCGVSNPSLDVAFGAFRRPADAHRRATERTQRAAP